MPTTVRPLPAYIAASVASQMVTDNLNAQLRQADSSFEELENVIFSEQALSLLNGFLDHLLFAFLSTARSPSLTAIRPAITEVLKPRLAREAAEAADEELQGLLSGEDDEEFSPTDGGRAIDRWDVEKVWKRTRLRIMVYTRLGEMEDEDEERYVQQERGLSMDDDEDEEAGLVSWASAIFLTSVVEYVAEQTLVVSGQAAYARMASRSKKSQHAEETDEEALERLVIEEPDVEKIALNSALGRLWRTWRKRVRSSLQPLSPNRGIRSNSSYTSLHRRGSSHGTADNSYHVEQTPVSERAPTETDIAANIPLPLGARDVDEIEVPGLARTFEETESSGTQTPVSRPQRPSSVIMLAPAENFRRKHNKERPSSMPGPEALPFAVPPRSHMNDDEGQLDTPFETPMTSNFNRTSYVGDENTVAPLLLQHKGEGNAHDDMLASAIDVSPKSERNLAKARSLEQVGAEPDTPTSTTSDNYDIEPKVLQSKRMSIGRSGPPGIVRTFSTRSNSLKSPRETPTATPMASTHAEARSYLDDHSDDEDVEGPQVIGVAHTSDVPIRSSPTPSVEPWTEKANAVPAQGGYVEVQPTPRSVPSRRTPTPESKPTIPERSVARNEVLKRASPGIGSGAGPAAGTASPPRRRDATPPTSGRTSLPSLQEVEHYKPHQVVASEQPARRGSPTFSNRSRTQSPHLASMSDARQVPRRSTEESLRSQSAAGGSILDKSGIKRVGSTSSKKSSSISRLPRDSDDKLNRNLGGRMSEEDRERQFEELVQGKETVKYTLTPENMRALDVSSILLMCD
jgi:hypothetical protein